MTTLEKYRDEVKTQISKGIDFNTSVWHADPSYFAEIVKKYRYRRSKTAYFGPGRSFYQLLQRVYNQMKERGEL